MNIITTLSSAPGKGNEGVALYSPELSNWSLTIRYCLVPYLEYIHFRGEEVLPIAEDAICI